MLNLHRDQIKTLKKSNEVLLTENKQLQHLNEKLVNRCERVEAELQFQGGINPFKDSPQKLLLANSAFGK